jgi:hypothetical protein
MVHLTVSDVGVHDRVNVIFVEWYCEIPISVAACNE